MNPYSVGCCAEDRCGRSTRNAQIAGSFVDFILHQIEGSDLDVGIEYFRRLRANLQAMPRMRTELTDLDESFVFARGFVGCALFHDGHSLDFVGSTSTVAISKAAAAANSMPIHNDFPVTLFDAIAQLVVEDRYPYCVSQSW